MQIKIDPLSIKIRSHLQPTPNVKLLKDILPVNVLARLVLDYLQPRNAHFESDFSTKLFRSQKGRGRLVYPAFANSKGVRSVHRYLRDYINRSNTFTCESYFVGHIFNPLEIVLLDNVYWFCATRPTATDRNVDFLDARTDGLIDFVTTFSVQQIYEPMKQIRAYISAQASMI